MSPQQKLEQRLNGLLKKDAQDNQDAKEAIAEKFLLPIFPF